MKNLLIGAGMLLVSSLPGNLRAQKISLLEGDLKVLAGVKEINIEFDYSDMKVGKMSETDYVAKKVKDYNKKEAGKGDNWAKMWVDDRSTRYEPKFIQNFTQFSAITAGPIASAKYTLKVKTVFTEPGFNIAVHQENAKVNLEVYLYETASKDKVLAKILIEKSPGGSFWGSDFDTGQRITDAYGAAGMSLGGFVRSKAL